MERKNIIYGQVANQAGEGLAGLVVRAYDSGLRRETLLGEATTNRDGTYEIAWSKPEANRAKATVNLALKVVTPKKQTELFATEADDIRFGADKREEINVVIVQAVPAEEPEYDRILAAITPLAANIAIADLGEDDQHRDLTHLARETGLPLGKIEHVVLAQRLEKISKIEAPFFYALLRKNTLLKSDHTKPLHARLFIDVNTDPQGVLYDAALAGVEAIERDVKQAAKDMLVAPQTTENVKRNLSLLAKFKKDAEAHTGEARIKNIIDLVTRFVVEDKASEAAKLFKTNKRDISGVVRKIANIKFLGNTKKVKNLETTLALGELVGFDQTIINQVGKAHNIKEPKDIRRLARLDKTAWKEELTKSAAKIEVAGKPINKRLVDLHASSLVRKMEKEFPSAAFVAQLEREKKPVLPRHKEMSELLTKHEDLDLRSTNIDLFFKKKKLDSKKNEPVRAELKRVQRVFRLVPQYSKATALLERNINSAQNITALGKARFMKEVAPAAGLDAKEAKEVFAKAENTTTAAMMIVGDLQDTAMAAPIPAFETAELSSTLESVAADFPNLKSLFKLADTCQCQHCRSVYSPAAYLVEILQFIDKRSVTDLTVTPHVTTNQAKDILFERRPDLGDIDLGCENANTPLPYIDLVCEQLEEMIAPDTGINYTGALASGADPLVGKISNALLTALQAAGIPVTDKAQVFATETSGGPSTTLPHYVRDAKAVCKVVRIAGNDYKVFRLRQTLSPAEELDAAPEYVNTQAYAKLKSKSYAFQLPFDLDHTEAKAYFERFDIARPELMKAFQVAGNPADISIAAEKLGLTAAERTLITTADVAGQQNYWNTAASPASGEMKVVATFLNKTGLSYNELVRLLTLKFIDPTDNLFIKHLDLSCDTTKKEIANLTDTVLDRVHRFLRLQKRTGWKLETLDEVISQSALGAEQLNDATLLKAADLMRIIEATSLKIDELIGFYGVIPHTSIEENPDKPLYYQIFLNKAKNGVVDEGLLPEKINGSADISTVSTSVASALQVKQSEFDTLVASLPDTKLTFANLSRLLLMSRLLKRLKLKADEFITLKSLTGITVEASLANTLDFVKSAQESKQHPLKLTDVQYMLRHEALEIANLELKDETILQTLTQLQAMYQDAFAANKSPFDPNLAASEQQEALFTLLGQFPEVSEEDAKTIAGFMNREWSSAANAKTLTDSLFAGLFDTMAIKTAIDALAAVPAGNDFSQESNDLLKALMDALASYRFLAAKQTALEAQLGTAFKTDADIIKAMLAHGVLKQPAPGSAKLRDIFLTDALIDTTNPVPAPPAITEATFGQHFDALRLLHKLLPLIASYELEPNEVAWLLEHSDSTQLGWFEWDSIPYKTGQTAVTYETYVNHARMVRLSKELTPVVNPADAGVPVTFWSVLEMTLPGSIATRAEFIEKLALLTGYEQTIIDEVDAHLFPAFNLNNYRLADTWQTVLTCAEYVRKLVSSVASVKEFIKPALTAAETNALRLALKSRYDETTWLGTLKEVMDAIRPQKRDALVAYVLATKPEFSDTNDLYDHLLIDVEMESCMPSSRIVQAHGAIQLFVQRCLMGLEPKAAADVENDSGWQQWKWMKLYRVWEANRKVFLYPENWIEAELRDDKSHIFTELENELQQNELTEFTAEQALIKYLERLDDIAFLEVVATWYQTDIKTMHVFARTKGGDPAIYYHRMFEQERYWTPWKKVELEITGDHLLAFVRNNRLTLAWPIFSEEPDPNPQSTVPSSTAGTVVSNDKPKRKLKIQLAVSEYANNVWQPKKVSQDAVRTPSYYTTEDLQQQYYNLIYIEWADKIFLLKALGQDSTQLRGIFDVAGCKGYPELAAEGSTHFPDFFPDFKDTTLKLQRYLEQNNFAGNDLAARTALAPFNFYEILGQTPGNFRLTYPHQMTVIDWLALLWQYLLFHAYGSNSTVGYDGFRSIKFPMGTLLPYFMEDSAHAYVITPGFYTRQDREEVENLTIGGETASIVTKRTASNVLQLIEDVIALYKKYKAKLDSGQSPSDVIAELLADEDYHAIVDELKVYGSLQYGEEFSNMYHPLICPLRKTLYKHGVSELMKRQTQLQTTSFNFETHYNPSGVVPLEYPIEDIDFNSDGSYSGYNWELFYHVPMLIATRLTQNQRFEEALQWFHYMFNPTGALEGDAPQKYWVTKPFYLRNDSEYIAQRIDTLLYKIADPTTPERKELEFAIDQWREKPFKPHVVARFRTVAYQKALLMKYIDNLVEWGDYLFRQDTMESIAQATQMYILADKLLGPKPLSVPPVVKPPYETYNQIEAKLDAFGNALIDLENILPDITVLPEEGEELPPPPVTLSTLYFCIPHNEKMLAYWDKIGDRLFKIRNCQNIEGIERSLALFAPPIDPGMLVKAAAAGLDISSILAGLNAPAPYYRFSVLTQKATELAQEVRGLGGSLLQALEKKDAEAISLLRSQLEIKVLNAVKDMKKLHITEATEQIEVLKRTKLVTEERHAYYRDVEKINQKEQLNLDKLSEAHDLQQGAQISQTLAGVMAMIPDIIGGASGFGGSPHVTLDWGGRNLAAAARSAADVVNIFAAIATYEANRASIHGNYNRRFDDWKLQERLSQKELASIDKQIVAAEIRKELAETDLKNHELQIENAKKTDDFMRSKFTNEELYDWMIGQIASVYFSAYKLAHDTAKKAERSYQFELGRDDSFIAYGYWDSLKKGLQSADRLIYDIKRMEVKHIDVNKREYEITKHVSLASLDPLALAKLRATGSCDFDVPEALYDMDHAGHYFRRLKTVSISLPCVAGPYTAVSAKLSLVSNKYRQNTNPDNLAATGYAEDPGNDERFIYNIGAIQSIATSNAQKDSGMFELHFRDDRYLPFEGTGAISTWRLELPKKELAQFDYDTIGDVTLHVNYTARDGGSGLRALAETALLDQLAAIKQQLSQTGLHTAINLKHDLPNEWHLLKNDGSAEFTIGTERLPYMAQALDATIQNVVLMAKVTGNPATFAINLGENTINLSRIDEWKLCKGETTEITLATPFEFSLTPANLAKLEELVLVVKYGF